MNHQTHQFMKETIKSARARAADKSPEGKAAVRAGLKRAGLMTASGEIKKIHVG